MNVIKLSGIIFGVLIMLAGGTFAFQGLGVLGSGSFMDSNPTWIYAGSFLFFLGLVLAVYSISRKHPSSNQN